MSLLLYLFPFPTTPTTSSSFICPSSVQFHDKPGEVCSRPSRPCLYTHPSRFRPLSEHCTSRHKADPRHRACGVSLGEQSGTRARPLFSLHTAIPAREGKKNHLSRLGPMADKWHSLQTQRDHIQGHFLIYVNLVLTLPSLCCLSTYLPKTTFLRSLRNIFSPIIQTAPEILPPSGSLFKQTKGRDASVHLPLRKVLKS